VTAALTADDVERGRVALLAELRLCARPNGGGAGSHKRPRNDSDGPLMMPPPPPQRLPDTTRSTPPPPPSRSLALDGAARFRS
jgi:hypothetical protein